MHTAQLGGLVLFFFPPLYLSICVWTCGYQGVHMEVRGSFHNVALRDQTHVLGYWQAALPTEQSHQPSHPQLTESFPGTNGCTQPQKLGLLLAVWLPERRVAVFSGPQVCFLWNVGIHPDYEAPIWFCP